MVDKRGDMVCGEAVPLGGFGHVATGRERHLALLDVEPCVREVVEAARVVVVEVREDDVGDGRGIDIDGSESLGRGAQELAPACRRVSGAEPRVDDPGRMLPYDRPHEVVHRHRRVVRVAADEVLGPARVAFRVLHRVDPMHRAVL